MASVTALELLNRVRLFRRQPTTDVIATPEDTVTLNAINMAIEDILSTRKWEFDLRTDGQLKLRKVLETLTLTTAEGSTAAIVTGTGLVDADVVGDYVVTLVNSSETGYENTSFRIDSSAGGSLGSLAFIELASDYPTTNSPAATGVEMHYGEYILPDTVKEVVRATYQEQPVTLSQVDPVVRYSEIFPRPNDDFGPPEAVAVGGYDIPTYDSNAGTGVPGLRMAVWPIPDADYILNYSYYYRHPELVAATDTLVGVPVGVVNDIVLQATSVVMMAWDQNFAGSHFSDLAQNQASAKFGTSKGSGARRHIINSFESNTGSVQVERGFPNKVIG